MPSCSVYGCKTSRIDIKKRKRKFYTFPKDPVYSELWLRACKRSDYVNTKTARICSLHFSQDSYYKPLIQTLLNYTPEKYRNLKPDAVPTENLPQESNLRSVRKPKKRLKSSRKNKQHPARVPGGRNINDVLIEIIRDDPCVIECQADVSSKIDSMIIEVKEECNEIFISNQDEQSHETSLIEDTEESGLIEDTPGTTLTEVSPDVTSDRDEKPRKEILTSSDAKWKTEVGILCRLCTKSDFNCIPIFRGKGEKLELETKILRYLQIEVQSDDKLPDQVCSVCLDALCAWEEYAQNCVAAGEKLKELLLVEDEELIDWYKTSSDPEVLDVNNQNMVGNLTSEINTEEENIHNNSVDNSESINATHIGSNDIKPEQCSDECALYEEDNIKEITINNEDIDNMFKEFYIEGTKLYKCRVCCSIFMNYPQCISHMKVAHSKKRAKATIVEQREGSNSEVEDTPDVQDVNDSVDQNNPEDNGQLKRNSNKENCNPEESVYFKCNQCSKKFISYLSLVTHKMDTHEIYICQKCLQTFPSSRALRRHDINIHGLLSERMEPKTCPVCKQQIEAFRFKKHLESHPGVCVKCFIFIRDQKEFEEHILIHSKDFKCLTCGKGFKTRTNLKTHSKTHLPDSVVKKFKCLKCGAMFRWKDSVKRHDALIHPAVKTEVLCHICSKTFPCQQYFQIHMRQVHSTTVRVQCEVCGKFFKSKKHLKQHMVCHLPSKKKPDNDKDMQSQIKCEKCKRYFASRTGLTLHSRSDCTSTESRMCYICGLILETPFDFQKHLSTHKSKPFKCDYCDRSFMSKMARDTHTYKHTGERPYACSVCDKRFLSKYNLILHGSLHSDSKPFKCHFCERTFRCKRYLTLHIRTHTEDKRYKCDICDVAFIQPGVLKRHKTKHYRTLPCVDTSSEGNLVLNCNKKEDNEDLEFNEYVIE